MKKKDVIPSMSFSVVAASVLFILALSLFSVLAHEVVIEKEDWFDSKVFFFLNNYTTPFIIKLSRLLTFFGSGTFLLPAYAVIIILLVYKKRKTDAVDLAILVITSRLLTYVLKNVFSRPRPGSPLFKDTFTYSFPSGHTFSSFVFFSVIAWEIWRSRMATKWKWVCITGCTLFSLAIGMSRIILRYHFASDVLAGLNLALAYVLLFFWLQKKWRKGRTAPSH
jgi:undecaprenyl-diphosphatase